VRWSSSTPLVTVARGGSNSGVQVSTHVQHVQGARREACAGRVRLLVISGGDEERRALQQGEPSAFSCGVAVMAAMRGDVGVGGGCG
jgi:hypothetical protein